MKSLRRIRKDKKAINTILASLLMVVIVVVAAVMVYAWSTGLLSSLLVQNPVPKETLNYDLAIDLDRRPHSSKCGKRNTDQDLHTMSDLLLL